MCTNCNNNTPCGCNQNIYQEVHICNQCPSEQPCDCPIKDLSTDCSIYNQDNIVCGTTIVVPKNTILSVALQQIVSWACAKFSELAKALSLINIGTGAEVYAGNTLLGEKKIRRIKPASPIVTVVQNTNDISIGIDTGVLQENQKTYSVVNIGSVGEGVYKNTTTVLNNNQFNFKKICSDTLSIKTSIDGNCLEINTANFSYLKEYYINSNYVPTLLAPADGSVIRPFPTFDEARNKMVGTGTIVSPENANATFILQTDSTTGVNPTVNTLRIRFENTSLTYTGSDTYMIDSEVLYPLVPKDLNNEITQSITMYLIGSGTLNRSTPGGYIRSIGAKRGSSTTVNNVNFISIFLGENAKDRLAMTEYYNYPNSVWGGDVLDTNGIDLLGNRYNPPLSLKWTTQISPTNPLIFIKGNSFATQSYPVVGLGNIFIRTFANTAIHIEDTNINLETLTIIPIDGLISVTQGLTFVPGFLGVYEPKNFHAIYAKNSQWLINSVYNINKGTFAFHGYDTFFKIEGNFDLRGMINYDSNFYIKTFADLTGSSQSYFHINGKTNSANLNSNINYLINSNIVGNFSLLMPNSAVSGVRNISQNLSTVVIPITNGTISSINSNPYLSGITDFANDATASASGALQNALYFNTTNNAIDKI